MCFSLVSQSSNFLDYYLEHIQLFDWTFILETHIIFKNKDIRHLFYLFQMSNTASHTVNTSIHSTYKILNKNVYFLI